MSRPLHVQALTWCKTSLSLFDHESRSNVATAQFKVQTSTYIVRSAHQVSASATPDQLQEPPSILCSVSTEDKHIVLEPASHHLPTEKLWLVVHPSASNKTGYKLAVGDVIKLGRVQVKVTEVHGFDTPTLAPGIVKASQLADVGLPSKTKGKPASLELPQDIVRGEEEVCRICLSEQESEDDPLITPCKCSGTMGVIHISCLQHWLNSKITVREKEFVVSYSWKELSCELCKFRYPETLVVGTTRYELLTIKKPEGNYVILETCSPEVQQKNRVVHVVSMQNKSNIRIGRSNDSDVKLNDASVSRSHAIIKTNRLGLFLVDNESKFGTLVKIKKPILLDSTRPLTVQCGRTLLTLALKSACWGSCLFRCGRTETSDEDLSPLT